MSSELIHTDISRVIYHAAAASCLLASSFLLYGCLSSPSKPQPPTPPASSSTQTQESAEQQQSAQQQSSESTSASSSEENSAPVSSSSNIGDQDNEPVSKSAQDSEEASEQNTGDNRTTASESAAQQDDPNSSGGATSQPGETSETGHAAASRAGQGQTWQEQTGELDQELAGSLSEFDGKLLREKELLKAQRNAQHAGGELGEESSSGEHGQAGELAGITGEESSGEGATPNDRTASVGGGNDRPPPAGRVPEDIPDGQDDDVVARQLREAAENEDNPVLREKLWQEYRNYKEGTVAENRGESS